jgi:hypothetical protein
MCTARSTDPAALPETCAEARSSTDPATETNPPQAPEATHEPELEPLEDELNPQSLKGEDPSNPEMETVDYGGDTDPAEIPAEIPAEAPEATVEETPLERTGEASGADDDGIDLTDYFLSRIQGLPTDKIVMANVSKEQEQAFMTMVKEYFQQTAPSERGDWMSELVKVSAELCDASRRASIEVQLNLME